MSSSLGGEEWKTYIPAVAVQLPELSYRREEDLIRHDPVRGASRVGLGQLAVEPVLLVAAHESPSRIIRNQWDVILVPAKVCDGPVVVSGVEYDKIEQFAHLEASPNSEIVIQISLSDGHPLEVRADSIHLPLVYADTRAIIEEALLGIVESGRAIAVAVVRDLMIVLHVEKSAPAG